MVVVLRMVDVEMHAAYPPHFVRPLQPLVASYLRAALSRSYPRHHRKHEYCTFRAAQPAWHWRGGEVAVSWRDDGGGG